MSSALVHLTAVELALWQRMRLAERRHRAQSMRCRLDGWAWLADIHADQADRYLARMRTLGGEVVEW